MRAHAELHTAGAAVLDAAPVGEVIFRPSSKGQAHLTGSIKRELRRARPPLGSLLKPPKRAPRPEEIGVVWTFMPPAEVKLSQRGPQQS